MRRAALGGLPLLLAITISASVLLDPVDWVVFLLTGFGWLALVAIQETDRASTWGRGPAVRPRLTAVGGLAARIAVTCGLVAVVLSSALSSEGRTFGELRPERRQQLDQREQPDARPAPQPACRARTSPWST